MPGFGYASLMATRCSRCTALSARAWWRAVIACTPDKRSAEWDPEAWEACCTSRCIEAAWLFLPKTSCGVSCASDRIRTVSVESQWGDHATSRVRHPKEARMFGNKEVKEMKPETRETHTTTP